MRSITHLMLCAAVACSVVGVGGPGAAALAQGTRATVSDPPGAPPDPAHVPFVLPTDITWTGDAARAQTALLYGDPSKDGPYAQLIKWAPGAFSQPHFHDQTRWIYVVSGTWWVSSSTVPDERTTYPMRAGTFVTDVANTVHWDGARTGEREPAIILLSGVGPVRTIRVDANGTPLPGQ